MAPAGASNRHGEITAVVAYEARQPFLHVVADVIEHALRVGIGLKEGNDRAIAAGQRAQDRIVVRVGQAAHVEHHVRIEWNPMLEAEGLEQQRKSAFAEVEQFLDPQAQRAGAQVAGIDVMAEVGQVGQQFALVLDRFGKGALAVRQRMAAAGFRVALHQRVGLGVEETQMHLDAAFAQFGQKAGKLGQRRAAAHVYAYGDALVTFFRKQPGQAHQQLGRQVVHAVVTAVLQHV